MAHDNRELGKALRHLSNHRWNRIVRVAGMKQYRHAELHTRLKYRQRSLIRWIEQLAARVEFQPFQPQLLNRSPDLIDSEWMLRIGAGKSDEFFRVSCDDFRYVIICS